MAPTPKAPTNEEIDEFVEYLRTKKNVPVRKRDKETASASVEYERSAATSNLVYRFSRPGCVILPSTVQHVQDTVVAAKERKIPMTIKNGGHSFAGFSTASNQNAVLMDLTLLREAELNKAGDIATVGGGALWGHAYKLLVNQKRDGWVVNGGRCPTVGVSGFTLGGGLGPFTRKFGMGCDTLKEATIVLADGSKVTVNDEHKPDSEEGKLFWALRGAGGANFGVVVEMKLKLQELRHHDVVAGMHTWYPDNDSQITFLETMNNFYLANWPDETTIDSSWLCALKTGTPGIGVRFTFYHDGPDSEFDASMDKYITDEKLADRLKRRSIAEPSSRFLHETLAAQWKEEAQRSMPDSKTYQIHVSFVIERNEKTIKDLTRALAKAMKLFRKEFAGEDEQALFQATFIHTGGKAKKAPTPDTSYHWRTADFQCYMLIEWGDKWLETPMKQFAMETRKILRPFSVDGNAAYVNFCDPFLDPGEHEEAYYGRANVEKLRRVKDKWDPDNFFNWSQGIKSSKKTTTETSDLTELAIAEDLTKGLSKEEKDAEWKDSAKLLSDTIAMQNWKSFSPPSGEEFLGANGGNWYSTPPPPPYSEALPEPAT